jgi:hypothetical protein
MDPPLVTEAAAAAAALYNPWSLPVRAASGSTTWHHLRKYNLKTSYAQKRFGKSRRKL